MLKTIRWCFMGLCMAFANTHAAPILLVDGTELTGANGVDVGGTLYDVRFVDGTCVALFSGCDSVSDFAFNSIASATQASAALLAQVFVDGLEGQFDSQPGLTRGCESVDRCAALTPFDVIASGVFASAFASNSFEEPSDGSGPTGSGLPATLDTTGDALLFYAVWTLAGSNVPLPGTLSCLGIGLLGLVLANRRRAQARCRTQ